MSNILYVCFLILCSIWALCYYGLNAGPFIHILLLIAALAIMLSVIKHQDVIE